MILANGNSLLAKVLKRARLALNCHGYDIHPIDSRCWDDQKALLYGRENLIILDVGANCGQTARQYRAMFPNSQICCFEPQVELCQEMHRRFRDDPHISVHPCAVGASEGTAEFYLNAKRATSSLLASETQQHLSPSYQTLMRTEEICSVRVTTLDSFTASTNLTHIDLLKMDIQGGECEALAGARGLLSDGAIDLIYSEVSFVPLYFNQPLFGDLASYLAKWDYKLHLVYNQIVNGITGRPVQADALFVAPRLQELSRKQLSATWIQ